jgi:hypothetical protein
VTYISTPLQEQKVCHATALSKPVSSLISSFQWPLRWPLLMSLPPHSPFFNSQGETDSATSLLRPLVAILSQGTCQTSQDNWVFTALAFPLPPLSPQPPGSQQLLRYRLTPVLLPESNMVPSSPSLGLLFGHLCH